MFRKRQRLLEDGGFGLLELVISMTFLSVAMAGISTLLVSSFIGTRNATTRATAGVLADGQMEVYYRLPYAQIRLKANGGNIPGDDLGSISASDPYRTSEGTSGFPASSSAWVTDAITTACGNGANEPPECRPIQRFTASTTPRSPDGHSYRLDTYIWCSSSPATVCTAPTNGIKEVLVVVRDYKGNTPGKVLATADSLFGRITAPS